MIPGTGNCYSNLFQLFQVAHTATCLVSTPSQVDHQRTFKFLNVCSDGDAEALRVLLGQGMSANCADYDVRTGLMLAAGAGHVVSVLHICTQLCPNLRM